VTRDADNIVIGLNHRSSCETALQAVAQSVESLARLAVVRYARGGGYPGWQPNMESEVLARARDLYKKLNGREFEVKAVHAGLECGIIGEKFPGMDMISFGPSLSNVHSPDERLEVASVPVFYKFLLALLEDLAK
jgi:dipeptidase D